MTVKNKNDKEIICTISNDELKDNGLVKDDIVYGLENPSSKARTFIDSILRKVAKEMELKDTIGQLSVYDNGDSIVLNFVKDIYSKDIYEDGELSSQYEQVYWSYKSENFADICSLAAAIADNASVIGSTLHKNDKGWYLTVETKFNDTISKNIFRSIFIEHTTDKYVLTNEELKMFNYLSGCRVIIGKDAIKELAAI